MKTAILNDSSTKMNIPRVALGTMLFLLIPLLLTQVSADFNWDETDFIVIGVLVFVTGVAIEFIRAKVRDQNQRFFFALVIVFLFLLTWAELAVGIFGTPFAGN